MVEGSASGSGEVAIKVLVDGEVRTMSFPMDPGVTEEKKRLMRELDDHARRPASKVAAGESGLRFEWDDGWPAVLALPAWRTWWADRPAVEGRAALEAADSFEEHLYRHIVGPKLAREIDAGTASLWGAVRDFPPVVEHSREIQAKLRASFERGEPVRPRRGERSAEYRRAILDGWLTTVSRVEEFRRNGLPLWDACAQVARIEGRKGRDPAGAVRAEYDRGRRWQRIFDPQR